MYDEADFDRIRGAVAFDRSGHRIGDVVEVFLDDATGVPLWVSVHTGLFGRPHPSLSGADGWGKLGA